MSRRYLNIDKRLNQHFQRIDKPIYKHIDREVHFRQMSKMI
nr:MAG TPA: hypothetical protein [Caudoviricetes sp.]